MRSALLTPRMKEIVQLKMKGLKNREIANKLSISESAVSQTLHAVADKVQTLNDSLKLLTELGLWPNDQGLQLLRPVKPSSALEIPKPIVVRSKSTPRLVLRETPTNFEGLIHKIMLHTPGEEQIQRYVKTLTRGSPSRNIFVTDRFKERGTRYHFSPLASRKLEAVYA